MRHLSPFTHDLLLQCAGLETGFVGYPDPAGFSPHFAEHEFRQAVRETNEDPIPNRLSVHMHLPFAEQPCLQCEHSQQLERDPKRLGPYLDRIARECGKIAPLFDRDRDVVQLKVGGGGPSLLDQAALADALHALSRQFFLSRSRDREFMIELDPQRLDAASAERYAELGFNRVRFATLDPAPAVRIASGRSESLDRLADGVRRVREAGFRSVCFDAVHALPGQSMASLHHWLESILALRPERISLLVPGLSRSQRLHLHDSLLLTPGQRAELHAEAVERVLDAGYDAIGLDVFALPSDDLARARLSGHLHRNALGYTAHGETDLIGFGVSALSRIGDACSQNLPNLPAWQVAVDMGELPIWRGLRLDRRSCLRSELLHGLMCRGGIDIGMLERRHEVDFSETFQRELRDLDPMLEAGLLQQQGTRLELVGTLGRLALRSICAVFVSAPRG